MKLVLDTSSLIAFYVEMNAPYLLKKLKKHSCELLVPFLVANEIREKDKSYQPFAKDVQVEIVRILEAFEEQQISLLRQRYPYLGDGEIEVILWGERFQKADIDYHCILDDKKARRVARTFSLRCTGTIGLIKWLQEWGSISTQESETTLRKLLSSGFRYKVRNSKYK